MSAPMVGDSQAGDIRTLQYGRGIAALLVCIFHFQEVGGRPHSEPAIFGGFDFSHLFRAGHSGVEFFFILSGFIIFHAHRRDLDCAGRLVSFYKKRAIRVLPMFWLTLIPFGLAILAVSATTSLTLRELILDALLVPREGPLLIPTVWTLQHEAIFYLLFGLLIINLRLGVAALMTWQVACAVVLFFDLLPQNYALAESRLFGFFNFGFLFGILIAMLYERIEFSSYRHLFWSFGFVGLAGLAVCFVGEARMGSSLFFPSPATASFIYFCLWSLVIVALLSLENRPRPFLDYTLGILGASSYALYLVHIPFASALSKISMLPAFRFWQETGLVLPISVILVVSMSVTVYYLMERPVLRWFRKRLLYPAGTRTTIGLGQEPTESVS